MSLKKIKLHGYLGKEFGYTHEFVIEDIKEGIRALAANFPTFLKKLREGSFAIVADDGVYKDEEQLGINYDNYHIVPVPNGSKGGFFQIFIGVVLIAAAFYTGGASLAAWGSMQTGMALMGAGMILGAFSTPQVQDYSQRESPDERASYLFNGPVNTVEQGGGVTLTYGRIKTGGHIISAELDIEDIS